MWLVATLTVLLAAFLTCPLAVQAREQPFDAGHWIGAASFDDDTGEFEHCRIEATYNSGITFAVGILPDFALVMVLTNPAWSLHDDVQFPLQLAVDLRWSKSFSGMGIAPDGVFVYIGDDWEAFEALRKGRELRVVATRETFEFLLAGTSFGLTEAARCVFRNSQVASQADPFSIQSDPFGTDAGVRSPTQSSSSASGITRNEMAGFLAIAGIENATLMTDTQREEMVPNAQHGWTTGAVTGAFAEYTLEGRTLQQVLAAEIAALSERCEGQVLSGSQPTKRIGNVTMARFAVSCDTTEGRWILNGTLVVGDASVAVIEHLGMAASTDAIKHADDLMSAAIDKSTATIRR